MKKLLSASLFIAMASTLCFGQASEKQKAIDELKSLFNRYTTAKYLSFDVAYKYASEQQPDTNLDSLTGNFKMNGASYWYSLDSTESLVNKEYSIMLFKEDKLLYLSKPTATAATANPFTMLDSSFFSDQMDYRFSVTKGSKKVIINFPPESKNKRIEYDIDSKTGFIKKIICVVQADQLYDPSVRNLVDAASAYAIVTIDLTHYKEGSFDEKQLSASRYFKKENNEYIIVAPYEAYKIFFATPNL